MLRHRRPLQRQIQEAFLIDHCKADIVLNPKSEWTRSRNLKLEVEDPGNKEKRELEEEVINEKVRVLRADRRIVEAMMESIMNNQVLNREAAKDLRARRKRKRDEDKDEQGMEGIDEENFRETKEKKNEQINRQTI